MPDEKRLAMPHTLILEERQHLTITGAIEIDSFDEQSVILFTDLGELTIRGENLHINRLSVETGEVQVEGDVQLVAYSQQAYRAGGGLWSKLFR